MPGRLGAIGSVFSFLVLAAPVAHAQATYQFDLPEQALADSLRAISTRTGTNILFDSKDVKDVKGAALHAELAVRDAIKSVLADTQLEVESTTPGSFIIRPIANDETLDNSTPLQEVLVSARRKEELLTTVPASITAYTSGFLARHNIRTFADYATKIPNLTFQYGQGADLIWSAGRETSIRGVAGTGTTAYYINDTPVPSSVSPQTLDLDRIEVLKGPQGTLFGASSMGGNLRFITRKPSLQEGSAAIQLEGGGTKDGGFDFDGSVLGNVVLVPDRIALDAAFGYTRESGYITRRFPDSSGNLVSKDGQGRDDLFTGSLTLRAKLSDSLEATVSAIGQASKLNGFPATYVPLPGYRPVSYTVDRDRDVQEYSKDRWGLESLVLNYAGQGFSVVSSTTYFARRIEENEDVTEGTNVYFERDIGVDLGDPAHYNTSVLAQRLVTHETRLAVDEGTVLPHLSGIAGFFYQWSSRHSYIPIIPVEEMEDAGLYPTNVGAGFTGGRSTDTAVFGEAYYEIVPKLILTLGLRKYWNDQKTNPGTEIGFIFGPDVVTNPPLRDSQSGLVPKAVLSYKIGDAGNLYASASKGFRAGGTQNRLPDICAQDMADLGLNQQDIFEYRSDSLWSYEIGAKSLLANGRLSASAAAFQIDWSDIQQNALLPTCLLSFVANAGKARMRGGELEIAGRPFENKPFSLQLGVGYIDGVLLDPGFIRQEPNSRLSQVPRWTGTVSGYYETPITDKVSLFAAADYSYIGSVNITDGLGGFLRRQPFNLVNGNIGVSFGRSRVSLYGKNLTDKRLNFGDQPAAGFEREELLDDGSYQRLPRAVVSRPRQIGVQYEVSF